MRAILLVEDEPELTHVVARELSGAGYRVEHAADGEAALRRFAGEPPDVVILDWMLPGLDGLEVLRRIRKFS
jgi:DNA-binding response OmpR family regulator